MQRLQMITGIIAAVFLISGGMSVSYGQQSGTAGSQQNATPQQSNVSNTDKSFVDNALKGGMQEIALGKQAASKSTNPDVQNFANHLIQDHTKANEQLMQIAQKAGLQVPNEMGSQKEEKLNSFSKLNGTDFDRAFISYEVQDHKQDIKDFQNEAKEGSNPGIKDFASQTTQKLQHHLSMAESLNQKFGAAQSTQHPWWEFWKKG